MKFRPLSDSNTGEGEVSDVPDFKTPLAPRPQSRLTQQLNLQHPTSIFVDNSCDLSTNVNVEEKYIEDEKHTQLDGADSPEDIEMRNDVDGVPAEFVGSSVPHDTINEIAVETVAVLSLNH